MKDTSRPLGTSWFWFFGLGVAAIGAQLFSSIVAPPSPNDLRAEIEALKEENSRIQSSLDSLSGEVERANTLAQSVDTRVSGITLTAQESSYGSEYGCAGENKAEPNSLTVMSGLRDGTSCKVTNRNYYKDLQLVVPE